MRVPCPRIEAGELNARLAGEAEIALGRRDGTLRFRLSDAGAITVYAAGLHLEIISASAPNSLGARATRVLSVSTELKGL